MESAVTAVDGERDPRCLLLGFQSIQELCCLYADHDPEVSVADMSSRFAEVLRARQPLQRCRLRVTASVGRILAQQRPCPMGCLPLHGFSACKRIAGLSLSQHQRVHTTLPCGGRCAPSCASTRAGPTKQGGGGSGGAGLLFPGRVYAAAQHAGRGGGDSAGAGLSCGVRPGCRAGPGAACHPAAAGEAGLIPQVGLEHCLMQTKPP